MESSKVSFSAKSNRACFRDDAKMYEESETCFNSAACSRSVFCLRFALKGECELFSVNLVGCGKKD